MDVTAFTPRGHALLRRGRTSLAGHTYHVTFTTQGRAPVFTDFHAACTAARCFAGPHPGSELLAWVLMPDHAHCLLELDADIALGGAVRRLKGRSSRAVNAQLSRSGALWARAYHDRALRREDDLRTVARYIVANPLRARLVERLGDYPFWDAVWVGQATDRG